MTAYLLPALRRNRFPGVGLATDPKTRKDWAKFTQLVDRTLQSFESVSEWADFITFLGKLLKVSLKSLPIMRVSRSADQISNLQLVLANVPQLRVHTT